MEVFVNNATFADCFFGWDAVNYLKFNSNTKFFFAELQ